MLSKKGQPYIIPEYSLTGDLLAYLNCGLQYRYYNRASLPPSTPVQLWFGVFIHAVLEEAYRRWKEDSSNNSFPWDWRSKVRKIEMSVYKRLAVRGLLSPPGLFCPYEAGEGRGGCADNDHPHKMLASCRADEAVNLWGPHLFPLITAAEVRLRGTRPMPYIDGKRSDYYGISGIVDVIASVEISKASRENLLLAYLEPYIEDSGKKNEGYEVLIDYKGMRRPSFKDAAWEHHEWQVLTYAWLRSCQPNSLPVKAGIIFYLNELYPSREDIEKLREDVDKKQTDVLPAGIDEEKLIKWKPGDQIPVLTADFRLKRSVRIIKADSESVLNSVAMFDSVVQEIESCVVKEKSGAPIKDCWRANFRKETCTACDFKGFCPEISRIKPYQISVP